jgi:predicted Zn-dependent protease
MRAVVLAVALAACAGNRTDPVTGEDYYSPLGNDFASQDAYVRRNFLTETATAADGGTLPEPGIQAACRAVLDEVIRGVPAAHRRDFEYRLIVSPSPSVNAYTYGAGRVHCHLGLIAFCHDASELAGMLAHEIGHVSHDHVGQALGRRTRLQSITSIGGIAGRPGRRLTETIGGIFGGVVLVQHTRSEEREADDLAVDYTRAAGFDPDGVARVFERLAAVHGNSGGFLATHPAPRNRVAAIRQRIADGGPVEGARRDTPAFARARARALEILPYYEALHESLAGDDMDAIIAAADRGIAALPHHAQFHFWKGIALENKEDRAGALDSLHAAVQRDESNLIPAYLYAILAVDSREYARAEQAATVVIRLVPVIPTAYLVRGVSRLALKRQKEAFADFDRLLALVEGREREKLLEQIRVLAPEYEPPPATR